MPSDAALPTDAANSAQLRRAARGGMLRRLLVLLIPCRGRS